MNCINRNSKEFKEMERATGFSSFLLNRLITNYQLSTGKDDYPSLEYLNLMGNVRTSTVINKIDDYTSEQYNSIEDSHLEVLFISNISEDANQSIKLEQIIRQELVPIANELNTPIKFIHNRNSTDKLSFVNGEIRINLHALNENDNLELLKKPLLAAVENKFRGEGVKSITNLESDYKSSDKVRVVTEFTINSEDGIITNSIEDLSGRTIINDNDGNSYLVNVTDETENILSDKNLSREEKFNELNKLNLLSEIVKDDNFNTVHNSVSESGILVIGNQPYLESNYNDVDNSLDLTITMFNHINKGIFNLSDNSDNDTLHDILIDLYKKNSKYDSNDNTKFSDYQLEDTGSVEVFPLGSLVFKTEEERDVYANRVFGKPREISNINISNNLLSVKGINGKDYQISESDIMIQETEVGPLEYIWDENRDLIRVIRDENTSNINNLNEGDVKRDSSLQGKNEVLLDKFKANGFRFEGLSPKEKKEIRAILAQVTKNAKANFKKNAVTIGKKSDSVYQNSSLGKTIQRISKKIDESSEFSSKQTHRAINSVSANTILNDVVKVSENKEKKENKSIAETKKNITEKVKELNVLYKTKADQKLIESKEIKLENLIHQYYNDSGELYTIPNRRGINPNIINLVDNLKEDNSKVERVNKNVEYSSYTLDPKLESVLTNISRNISDNQKKVLDKYGYEYSGVYGKIRNTNYMLNTESRKEAQSKLDIISKSLNANVIFDETLEAKAALLSTNSYRATKARLQGDNRPIIVLNPNFLSSDTVFHEFGHLYIELLGENDPLIQKAINQLIGTELYTTVKKQYPELSDTNLDKEVLATALGMEGDMIFKRSLEKLTLWQSIKRAILDAMRAIFNLNNDALEQLAKEVLGERKSRVKAGTVYSSTINFYSKYKVDTTKNIQQEAKKLFEELTANSDMNEETHRYSVDNIEYVTSITSIVKQMRNSKFKSKNKGSRDLKFDINDFDKDILLHKLDAPKIPAALADALDEYVDRKIDGTSSSFTVGASENWADVYGREMKNGLLGDTDNATSDELTVLLAFNTANVAVQSTFKESVIQDYDKIMERATFLQKVYNSSSIMGNIVHDAVEKFIKSNGTEEFPANIENSFEFVAIVNDIVNKGEKEGSIFFSEQILFDEDTRSPGTADLIEITKDGKFKLYDFKTIGSYINKQTGNELTDYQLYYSKGYVHQLMSYGEILKKYGIEPHEDPYHILMTQVSHTDPSKIAEDLSGEITLSNPRLVSIKNIKNQDNAYRNTSSQVRRYFQNKKVSNISLKAEIKDVNDAVDRVYHVIAKYNKTLSKVSQGTNVVYDFNSLNKALREESDDEAIKKHSEEVKYEYKKYISKNNKLIINKFLDQIHSVMGELNDFHNDGTTETSSQYLKSLNYVTQLAESIYDIRKGLTSEQLTKDGMFTIEEAAEVETKINETIDAIIKNRTFYKSKLIQNSLYMLAVNSNMQEGLMVEKLEIEARKVAKQKGIPLSKDFITKYVQERIRDKKDVLESNEMDYWTAQYENGILDLRLIEAWIADPGMIDSQIIQIVKQMMDSNELFVRHRMMELAPEMVQWNDQIESTGSTKSKWGKYLTKSKVYIGQTDSYELIEDGGIIPEFVSEYYYDKVKYENEKRNLNRKKKHLLNTKDYNKETADKIDEINDALDKLASDFRLLQKEKRQYANYTKIVTNPDFEKLSNKEKENLRFIHRNLKEADDCIDDVSKKLNITVNGVTIYNLPKQRASMYEIGIGQSARLFKSKVGDLLRPPADEDTENITDEEREINLGYESGTAITDLKGNQHLEIPLFYRNELEDPRLQSFDIPTLLLENHQATLTYQQATMIEADLFVIKESINSDNNDKILRVDSLTSKLTKDVSNIFKQRSSNNNLYKALNSSIENRLQKRSYMGVFSKNNYRLIKGLEYLKSYTTINGLTLNFKSMMTTSLQGSIYRMIEGYVGEHFNMKDWREGTMKAYKDMPAMIADTQKFVQDSKTNLLIKYFGMEQRETALSNKFVQSNALYKNLDSSALFAVTAIAENTVTSMLMYSMLNNVKVMDKDQNYINKDGNIVTDPKDAMSLDEAYTVENGKLVLHPKVVYTNRDYVNKYIDGNSIDSMSVNKIGSRMNNIYANMYGQYNEKLKTMAQRTAIGKMAFSMKGWLVRGMHQRWRGVTSAIPFKDNFISFEDMRDDRNLDKRFYSQDSQSFHEGYHATSLRYFISVAQKMKSDLSMAAFSNVYSSMTTHERANLKRSMIEGALIIASYVLYTFVAALAKAYDDEDDEASEKFYFVAYMTYRLNDELSTFISPLNMMNMMENPAPAFNSVNSIIKLLFRIVGASYTIDEGLDWNINDRYQKGSKEDQLKIKHDVIKLMPGVDDILQGLNLMGVETGKSMEDQFKGQMMAEQQ